MDKGEKAPEDWSVKARFSALGQVTGIGYPDLLTNQKHNAGGFLNKNVQQIAATHISDAERYMSPGGSLGDPAFRRKLLVGRLTHSDVQGTPVGLDFLQTHLASDRVIVFVVVRGEPVVLEDAAGMFPSDTLISQLRLLK